MRIMIMFDLPSKEDYEKKEYTVFRKNLIKNGYIMMQFSVYIKCVTMQNKTEQEINKIKNFIPQNGNIRVIEISENQYKNMRIILGNKNENEKYNSVDRYVKI